MGAKISSYHVCFSSVLHPDFLNSMPIGCPTFMLSMKYLYTPTKRLITEAWDMIKSISWPSSFDILICFNRKEAVRNETSATWNGTALNYPLHVI